MKYFLDAILNNYANFSGRATRLEFGMYILCVTCIFILAIILGVILISIFELPGQWLMTGICLLLCIPTFSISVRRLHDMGYSGIWVLLDFLPPLNIILTLALFCVKSNTDPKTNPYISAHETESF